MATEQEITENWGNTHTIEKIDGINITLSELLPGQAVAHGDGATFHWRLTAKDFPSAPKTGGELIHFGTKEHKI